MDPWSSISFRDVISFFRRQGPFIVTGSLCVSLLVLIGAIGLYLWSPSQEMTSLPFSLKFRGIENGLYPSGVEFTTSDLVAAPVVRDVYTANELQRFTKFEDFSERLFVVEENDALRRVMDDYRARLADPKLSAVDRERLEREFELKKESIARNSYKLTLLTNGGRRIPEDVEQKILNDILETWAEYAQTEKGATRYQFPVLSTKVIPQVTGEPVVALDMLRRRIWDVIYNIRGLRALPGAEGLRTKDGTTLAQMEVQLTDILRLEVESLLEDHLFGQRAADRRQALRFFERELEFTKRAQGEARAKANTYKDAMTLYSDRGRGASQELSSPSQDAAGGVMPQVDDSFLSRIVEMGGHAEDQRYRQKLVEAWATESLKLAPFEPEIAYYEGLLQRLRASEPTASAGRMSDDLSTLSSTRERVLEVVSRAEEIYLLASENLNASRSLFRVSGPVETTTARSLSFSRLLLTCVFLLFVGVSGVVIIAFTRERARTEA